MARRPPHPYAWAGPVYGRTRRVLGVLPDAARPLISRALIAPVLAGDRIECTVCRGHFRRLLRGRNRPSALCPRCGSHERHRLIAHFLDRDRPDLLGPGTSLLHFAPEPYFEHRFRAAEGLRYVTADLNADRADVACDLKALPFGDGEFDVVLCSHVLEHVDDDRVAIAELHRVLAPGGTALVLVPVDEARAETYEDPAIVAPADREREFWQDDHVRLYGRDTAGRLAAAGFEVLIDGYVHTLASALIARHAMYSPGMYVVRRPVAGGGRQSGSTSSSKAPSSARMRASTSASSSPSTCA